MFDQTTPDGYLIIFGQSFLIHNGMVFVDEDHRLDTAVGGEIIHYVDFIEYRLVCRAVLNGYNLPRETREPSEVPFFVCELCQIIGVFS